MERQEAEEWLEKKNQNNVAVDGTEWCQRRQKTEAEPKKEQVTVGLMRNRKLTNFLLKQFFYVEN